jgi:hypothetical protein
MTITKERMIELCQGQLDAYNERNIEKFATFYHPEVKAYRLQGNEVIVDGIQDLFEGYKKRFDDNPKLYCELKSRVVLESTVLDEEWVTGVTGQDKPSHVVAIYNFKDNLIHSIWFTR